MDSSDTIDSESLQAVKSLKSKFERLASETPLSSNAGHRPSLRPSESLGVAPPPSPIRRASNSQLKEPGTSASHLRTSSSSSDLNVLVKRAPPPPPPRGSAKPPPSPSPTPSPAPSPLLRPIPIPPSRNEMKVQELDIPPSVSALRTKFASNNTPPSSPSRTQSRRPNPDSKPNASPRPIPPRTAPVLVVHRTESPDEFSGVDDEVKLGSSPARRAIPPPVPGRPISLRQTEDDLFSSPSSSTASSCSYDDDIPPPSTSPQPPPIPARRTNGEVKHNHSSDSSQTSYDDTDTNTKSCQPLSSRIHDIPHSTPPPPRPPPRPTTRARPSINPDAVAQESFESKLFTPPPPLPARKATIMIPDPAATAFPPPLPTRTNGNDSPIIERRPLGSGRLPPPPTRTIGPGDKLPPARLVHTPSSDDDSGEEDEPKVQAIDMMPDSSMSSRRPPILAFRDGHSEPRIHIHPHSGAVAMSGSYVVVSHHSQIKIFDLSLSDIPIFNYATRDMGLKDSKITCMEFRPSANKAERGYLVWAGTKEGHLCEIDVRTGVLRSTKYAAHLHPVTHIFRHARSMITMDESGKALIFSPDLDSQEDISLTTTIPRIIRTTEKQDFVKLIDGKLWSAARLEHHASSGPQRLPVIRVFDIFNPASAGRSILPTEHVGPVTSATIIPSQPGFVYMGHEEGYISIWELNTDDGYPICVEVTRVSMSDVLSLEGVNDKLWAGSRNGMISAYDVSQKPWRVTNHWNAHPQAPVMKLMVNHYAIAKGHKLCVASVGRDESVRLWDGLLGLDWVDKELVKLEPSFSSFRDLSVLVVSWNCDSARPDNLSNENEDNFHFLRNALHSVDEPPDVIAFGFQEVIDLESRKMTAKNVILGSVNGKKKSDDGLSDKVTRAYKRWYDRLVLAVKSALPKESYCVVHTESLVGLFSCIFVKASQRTTFDDTSITTVKRGMGGRYGNKGAIVARFVIGDSSLCFINCHLAAGQNAVRRRNADAAGILEERSVFEPTQHPLAYVGGGDGTMILDHEFVVFSGDMNYRIDHRRDAILAAVRSGDISTLHVHDQLLREIKFNRACRLRGFMEGPLTFLPTYKYDRGTDEYDTSEKKRAPAWCDRVLWYSRVNTRVRQMHYRRYEVNVSDHRPISAAFSITVKRFDHVAREKAKAILQAKWAEQQEKLLNAATKFYVHQALL